MKAFLLLLCPILFSLPGCRGKCKEKGPPTKIINGDQVKHGPKWRCWSNGSWKEKMNYRYDLAHGEFELWHKNGKRHFLAYYENGKHSGTAKSWHQNGILSAFTYMKNGKLQGKAKGWYRSGKKKYVNNWVDGKQHGKGTYWNENGKIKAITNYNHGKLISTQRY